ncbi:MAG: hypothetical protein P1R58_09490 [bacterium]|nr:hypothetical protein [bacterium]
MRSPKSLLFKAVATSMIVLMAGLFFGCSSKSSEDSVADTSSLTLSVSPTVITKGKASVIEATVTSGGAAVPDQAVSFSVSPASAGSFTPSDTVTDADGVAATVFSAITSGSATITASVAGGTITKTAGITVSEVSQEGSGNITLSVTPSLILANGSDTSRITVAVADLAGSPAPESTLIRLTAGEKFVDIDGNGYWSDGIDSLVFDANANGSWDAIGNIPANAYTTGTNGLATVDFLAGNDATTVYIRASVDDNGITGYAETTIQQNPDAFVNSIYLASDSMSLSVKGTGGIETGLLRAVCYDANGNSVPEGLQVAFTISAGPGGGEHLGNVGTGPFYALTNAQGTATASIHSGTISGTVRIRANVDTVMSEATQILISAGPPANIVVGAGEDFNVPYWNIVGEEQPVTAIVSDIYLNPVNDSTVVYFWTDEGTVMSHMERTMEGQGIATSKWFSGNNVDSADGRVWIFAETHGGTVFDSTMFFNTSNPVTMWVVGAPATMVANGEEALVEVHASDINANPVDGGVPFDAISSHLIVSGGTFENGWYGAFDNVKIKTRVLTKDESRTGATDDGIGANARVTYYSGIASTFVDIAVLTDSTYRGQSVFTIQGQASPLEVISDISVVIKDRYGNPLADHTLVMTVSGGTITPGTGTQTTNSFGEAVGFIWTAPNTAGATFTVTVQDTDPRGNGVVLSKQVKVEI